VNAKALNFEIAELDTFGPVDATKDRADRVCRIARTSQGPISHAVTHSMARAVVKREGGSAGAGVAESNYVPGKTYQKDGFIVCSENDRSRKGGAFPRH
jgi:predicted sugar kinase